MKKLEEKKVFQSYLAVMAMLCLLATLAWM